MKDYQWIVNSDWRNLPEPCQGDQVQLKFGHTFNYMAKVTVVFVTDDKLTGRVDAIFDEDLQAPVTTGEVFNGLSNKQCDRRLYEKVSVSIYNT
jgi:hypothetical protein